MMSLGAFSVSLAVKDIARSRAFYEALGFTAFHGDQSQGWLIMSSPTATIGLFQGMFDSNILTFNPGWTSDAQNVDPFEDVRDIQARLKAAGLALDTETDPAGTGPAHVVLKDPDGNVIMFDQHR
jgi:catechol 2,3-dioxygenase-like lactoylglutathione lyase family enzyme